MNFQDDEEDNLLVFSDDEDVLDGIVYTERPQFFVTKAPKVQPKRKESRQLNFSFAPIQTIFSILEEP